MWFIFILDFTASWCINTFVFCSDYQNDEIVIFVSRFGFNAPNTLFLLLIFHKQCLNAYTIRYGFLYIYKITSFICLSVNMTNYCYLIFAIFIICYIYKI